MINYLIIKNIFDRTFGIIIIIILIPIYILIALLIKVTAPRDPIFFYQEVMGINATKFKFIKFRTMVPHEIDYNLRKDNANSHCGEIPLNHSEVTFIGRILRRFKIDEITQFFHVVSGKMSIIGPRPMDPARYKYSNEFERQRLLVKPGLTGLAQVSGNTHFTWEERIQFDILYIKNMSLKLDIHIFIKTFEVVICGEKINNEIQKNIF